jgi:hypothetical protein
VRHLLGDQLGSIYGLTRFQAFITPCRELRAVDAAALKLIQQLLPLLGRTLHSAQNVGLAQNRFGCGFRCRNKTRRSFHTGKYYDAYDPD